MHTPEPLGSVTPVASPAEATSAVIPPRLIERWGARDLATLVARRAEEPDHAVLGVYDRAARRHVPSPQHVVMARAFATGEALRSVGVGAGDPVVIAMAGTAETVTTFLGAVTIGALPVIHPARTAFGAGQDEDRLAGVLALLGDRARAVCSIAHPDLDVVVLDPPDTPPLADLADLLARRHHPAPDDVAYVQMTSGSTGVGRAVAVTHSSLFANVSALTRRMGMQEGDGVSSWLPLHHDMGLVGMTLLPLLQGNDCWLCAPFDFLADPSAWFRGFSEHRATMAASPDFGYAYATRRVRDADLSGLDLSTWRTACNGAEPVRLSTMRRFVERFGPHGFGTHVFTPCYGLAEVTLGASMKEYGEVPRFTRVEARGLARLEPVVVIGRGTLDDDELAPSDGPATLDAVACGPGLEGVGIVLVDEQGTLVNDEGVCGEILIAGPSVTAGYLRPGGGGVEPFAADGYLPTGDVGFVLGGELHVVERLKNLIIRNGRNHSAQVLEQVLTEVTGVPIERVAVIETELHETASPIVAVVERDRGTPSPEQLAGMVSSNASRFDLPLDSVLVIKKGGIPTTTSGKKRHAELRERLREGGVEVLARVDLHIEIPDVEIDLTAGVAERVVAAVAAQVRLRGRNPAVNPMSRLRADLDLDSADLFEVALILEERLSVAIPEGALQGLDRVADLIAAVELVVEGADGVAGPTLAQRRAEVLDAIPQLVVTVSEQRGRRVMVDGRWVVDLASCNYLGLDLHPTVIAAVHPAVERWGVHPSWTRAVASPAPYAELEERLSTLIGVPDVVVYPTVTLAHLGVLPPLVGSDGVLLVDEEAHHSIQEAAALTRARGAMVVTTPHGDLEALDRRLALTRDKARRVIAVDGVYSMSGEVIDLAGYIEVARRHEAVIYVDDAHGFGVIGHTPTVARPYGHAGDGVVRHLGLAYDHVVYVSGLSKAYSSMAAFVSCTGGVTRRFLNTTSTQVFSGPIPVASLASAIAGLGVNAVEGDDLRDRLYELTRRLVDGVADLGLRVRNEGTFPIVFVELGTTDVVTAACRSLWDDGVLLTPSLFPAVPLDRGGVRFTLTAANDDSDVDVVLDGLQRVRETLAVALET